MPKGRDFTEEEDEFLRNHPEMSARQLAKQLNRSRNSIIGRRRRKGIATARKPSFKGVPTSQRKLLTEVIRKEPWSPGDPIPPTCTWAIPYLPVPPDLDPLV